MGKGNTSPNPHKSKVKKGKNQMRYKQLANQKDGTGSWKSFQLETGDYIGKFHSSQYGTSKPQVTGTCEYKNGETGNTVTLYSNRDGTVGINWGAWGTQTLEVTEQFRDMLTVAIKMAQYIEVNEMEGK